MNSQSINEQFIIDHISTSEDVKLLYNLYAEIDNFEVRLYVDEGDSFTSFNSVLETDSGSVMFTCDTVKWMHSDLFLKPVERLFSDCSTMGILFGVIERVPGNMIQVTMIDRCKGAILKYIYGIKEQELYFISFRRSFC